MATAKKTAASGTRAKPGPAKTASAKTTSSKTASAKSAPAKTAPAKTSRGLAQDRGLISAVQRYEVSYEASKTGHSVAEVKAAIANLGHSRIKVTKALTGK